MAQMQAVYYRAPDGSEPVDDFIESLNDAKKQVVLDNQIDRLNMLGPNDPPLPFPWSFKSKGSFGSFAVTTAQSSTGSSTGGLGTSSCSSTYSERTQERSRSGTRRSPGRGGRISRLGWTLLGVCPRGLQVMTPLRLHLIYHFW